VKDTATPPVSAAGRAFYAGSLATALFVGALQALRVNAGMLTSYGADVFGTAWLYAMFRQGATILQRGRRLSAPATAAVVFAGCAGSEWGQRLDLIPGRFDPYDLVAFAVTVAACYVVDRFVVALA
jgi:hypothetical protein